MKRLTILLLAMLPALALSAYSETFHCPTGGYYKMPTGIKWINTPPIIASKESIAKRQFSIKFEWSKDGISYLSRCSYVDAVKMVTCDRYEVDRVDVYDPNPGSVDSIVLVKAYVFRSQLNFQIDLIEMTYIEDNGRGGIRYGTCTKL